LADVPFQWYTRKEQPLRIGLWYTANGAGIALGGLLGYAIGHIRGALPSWRYEFIIIGCLCCSWGIVIGIFMPDSPVTAKFLNRREKRVAVERLKGNQTGVENKHLKVETHSSRCIWRRRCSQLLFDHLSTLTLTHFHSRIKSKKPSPTSNSTSSSPSAWWATCPTGGSRISAR
jgi:MFS family permease